MANLSPFQILRTITMWLRNIIGHLSSRSRGAKSSVADVEIVAKTIYISGFREFTPPANVQIGARLRSGASHSEQHAKNSIIPIAGVKVP